MAWAEIHAEAELLLYILLGFCFNIISLLLQSTLGEDVQHAKTREPAVRAKQ